MLLECLLSQKKSPLFQGRGREHKPSYRDGIPLTGAVFFAPE
jgi:hypothetical protein